MRTIVTILALLSVFALSGCSTLGGQAASSIAPATFHSVPVHTGPLHADYSEARCSQVCLASFAPENCPTCTH